jgi:hypothetical protein
LAFLLKIDGTEIPVYPSTFSVDINDIDDGETSIRTADGTLNRDRIAQKRQIEMSFGIIKSSDLTDLMMMINDIFFEFYYFDPLDGTYATKTFYCSKKSAGIALVNSTEMLWDGLKLTLTER